MLYLNIYGLLQHIEELNIIIEDLHPAVICLSETHITPDIYEKEFNIKGYNFIDIKSHSNKTGGCIIYVREDIKILKSKHWLLEKNTWIIGTTIRVCKASPINIYNLYHSPSSSTTEFLTFFENWIEANVNPSKLDSLVMGDFNVNMLLSTTYSRKLKNIMLSTNLKLSSELPTRVTNTTSTQIDLVFTNIKSFKLEVMENHKCSDHETLMCTVQHQELNNTKQFTTRIINKKNVQLDEIKRDITSMNRAIDKISFEVDSENYMSDIINIIDNRTYIISVKYK